MKHLRAVMGVLLFVVVLRSCTLALSQTPIEVLPAQNAVFSATRSISCLMVSPDGALWAGTGGGVTRFGRDGKLQSWTRLDGLPAHEALNIRWENKAPRVMFPTGEAVWRDNAWQRATLTVKPSTKPQVQWRGAIWTATLEELHSKDAAGKTIVFSLPPSTGTHISALLVREDVLWAALFGDGLWQFDGKSWTRLDLNLPGKAREITALAEDEANKVLYVGTRRDGVWRLENGGWQLLPMRDEPFEHNVQNMTMFNGALWFSTLEDGLVVRNTQGWQHWDETTLSSNAPRQLVVFGERLYVRHGGGKVDSFDGQRWTRDVFAALPRKKVLAMSGDAKKLYLVQWGGWSEWNGAAYEHFLNLPALQGLPLMTLLPEGSRLWIGTQNRGLLETVRVEQPIGPYPRNISDGSNLAPTLPSVTYTIRPHDERHGLPDDWITAIARSGKVLYAGTFVGGLAIYDGKVWKTAPLLRGENVTSLAPDNEGGVWISTRRGLWHRDVQGRLIQIKIPHLDSENQALCATDKGLWIGSRTGVFWLTQSTLQSTLTPLSPK
jgi:ligand-binding sensor domain-containing protein